MHATSTSVAWIEFVDAVRFGSSSNVDDGGAAGGDVSYGGGRQRSPEVYSMQFAAADVFATQPKGLYTDRAKARAWDWLKGSPPVSLNEQKQKQQGQQQREYVPASHQHQQYAGDDDLHQAADRPASLDDALRQYRKDIATEQHKEQQSSRSPPHTHSEDDSGEGLAAASYVPSVSAADLNFQTPRSSRLVGEGAGTPSTSSGGGTSTTPGGDYERRRRLEQFRSAKAAQRRQEQQQAQAQAQEQRAHSSRHQQHQPVVELKPPIPSFFNLGSKLRDRRSFEHPVDHSTVEREAVEKRQMNRVLTAISGARDVVPESFTLDERETFQCHLDELEERTIRCRAVLEVVTDEVNEQKAVEAGLQLELATYKSMLADLTNVVTLSPPSVTAIDGGGGGSKVHQEKLNALRKALLRAKHAAAVLSN